MNEEMVLLNEEAGRQGGWAGGRDDYLGIFTVALRQSCYRQWY